MKEDFKDRLARLEAKHEAQQLQPSTKAAQLSAPAAESGGHGARPGAYVPWAAIKIVIGIAALGWGVHMTSEKLMVLLPAGGFADATVLENAVLRHMTPEEIERMHSDPNLAGKSQLERLLQSH